MRIDLEKRQALTDIRRTVFEWGQEIPFFLRTEKDITRGSLGTQISHSVSSLQVHAYPIQRNPNEKQLQSAGLSESCNALIYTSAQEWVDLGVLTFEDLIAENFDVSRMTVGLDGKEWKVSQVGFTNRIGDSPTYVTFALS